MLGYAGYAGYFDATARIETGSLYTAQDDAKRAGYFGYETFAKRYLRAKSQVDSDFISVATIETHERIGGGGDVKNGRS